MVFIIADINLVLAAFAIGIFGESDFIAQLFQRKPLFLVEVGSVKYDLETLLQEYNYLGNGKQWNNICSNDIFHLNSISFVDTCMVPLHF